MVLDSSRPEAFNGSWRVDQKQSDSIEPMLKAMGVSLVVRKLAQSVKVLQKLTVSDNQFIVMNISKYAEDKTVHFMNVGQRVILTPKGEKVLDTCTFETGREFPLEIKAILPNNKGETEDKRRLCKDGNSFVQHLTFFPPKEGSKPKPKGILMKRIFVRVQEKKPKSELKNQPGKKVEELPNTLASDQSSSLDSLPVTSATESKRSPESVTAKAEDQPQFVLWPVLTLCLAGLMILGALSSTETVPNADALLAGAVLLSFYLFSRMHLQASLELQHKLSWTFSIISVLAGLFLKASVGLETPNTYLAKSAGLYVAISFFVSKYCVHQTSPDKKKPQGLRNRILCMEIRERWSLLAVLLLACSLAFFSMEQGELNFESLMSGDDNQAIFLCLVLMFLVARAYVWNIGDEVEAKEEIVPKSASKTEENLEAVTATVVDHRIRDDIYTQYKVLVKTNQGDYHVWRRFSQFDCLRNDLRGILGAGTLPRLPAKTYFFNMGSHFLETRQEELNEFLQELLCSNGGKKIMLQQLPVRQFLGLGQSREKQ